MDGVESKKKDSANSPGTKDHSTSNGGNLPSGFILKLYQMVNGAPDEVITVSFFSPYRKASLYNFFSFEICIDHHHILQ